MKTFLTAVFHWSICELILGSLLFLAYKTFSKWNESALDRYSFLRLTFWTLLLLPFVPLRLPLGPYDGTLDFCLGGGSPSAPSEPSHLPWMIGGFVFSFLLFKALRIVISLSSVRKVGKRSEPASFQCRWPVLLTEREDLSPMTIGIFSPRVVLPKKLLQTLSLPELSMVLEHELIHADRRDGLSNFVRLLVKEALFFNPLVGFLCEEFEETMELSVDQRVLSNEEVDRRGYGELILRLNDELSSSARFAGSPQMSKHFMVKRLSAMKDPLGESNRRAIFGGALLFTLVSLLGLSSLDLLAASDAPLKEAISCNTDRFLEEQCSPDKITANSGSVEASFFLKPDSIACPTCGRCGTLDKLTSH